MTSGLGANTAPLPPTSGAGNPYAPPPPAYVPATASGPNGTTYIGLEPYTVADLQYANVPEPVIALADGIAANIRAGAHGIESTATTMGPATWNAPQAPNPTDPLSEQLNSYTPNVLNGTMDPTYPALTARHVYIMRVLGIPEASINDAAQYSPTALEVEQYVQTIIADPESLDVSLGRDAGTTRQLLAQIPAEILANPNPDAYPTPQGPDPVVDQPDAQYPSLASSHVIALRAMGVPEENIATLAAADPNPAEVEERIQQYIAAPEALDQALGNPIGTARAGLASIGIVAPGSPMGTPYAPVPQSNPVEKAIHWGIGLAVAAGIAFLGWKLLKGHAKPPGGVVPPEPEVVTKLVQPTRMNLANLSLGIDVVPENWIALGRDPGEAASGLMEALKGLGATITRSTHPA